MRGKLLFRWVAGLVVPVLWTSVAWCDVRLPGVFSDHMVLQSEAPLPVWGWAEPGEKVTVRLGEQIETATADAAGRWSLKLRPMNAGGPRELKVEAHNTVRVADVLLGEVWLCSGQSNMAMSVAASAHFDEERQAADYPPIRMFTVNRVAAQAPEENCDGDWKVCSPETVGGFSATAYFFGRRLHRQLGVPVGLINSSWGGTPVQAWTRLEDQQAVAKLEPMLANWQEQIAAFDAEAAKQAHEQQMAAWEKKVAEAKAAGRQPPRKPRPPVNPRFSPHRPANLYNGMIAPLVPYALRGAIWYQGESNAGRYNASLYGLQLITMINNWRRVWNQGDFPFLWVQLPNYRSPQQQPVETSGWVIVQEQMLRTLAVPNTGMAVTIDVGEADDIHPKNKQDVGKRLALWALGTTYGKDLVYSGPLYRSASKHDGKTVVRFDHADGGLVAKGGGPLRGFAIAGPDREFVWAEARIDGHTVVVSSPQVQEPAAVRYAWASNPQGNLCNQAGLPASPFRTDDWPE